MSHSKYVGDLLVNYRLLKKKTQVSSVDSITSLTTAILITLSDLLLFVLSLYKVWGTWKLKREAGIQRSEDLVSILLKQSKLRTSSPLNKGSFT